ncbi:MAG: type II secretion system F family protein [Patescibacteria group bacterium]|nr:type II secretion system F family protein [Patescibacteria group bacterium]
MPIFTYTAKDKAGNIQKGDLNASSRNEAAEIISSKDFIPVSIVEKKVNPLFSVLQNFSYIPRVEKVIFFRQLATLINAGISLMQSLTTLQKETTNKKMKAIVTELVRDVEGGSSFYLSLKKHEKVFGPIFVSMINAGEIGGTLDKTLELVADQIEKDHEISAKIKSAMTYPTVIVVAMFGAVFFMMTSVIPELGKMFKEMNAELPMSTKILITVSNAMASYGFFIIILLIGLAAGIRYIIKNVQFVRKRFHFMVLHIPVLGKTVKKINIIRFTRTLGSLLDSGIPIVETLEIIADATQNLIFKEDIVKFKEEVKDGITLSKSMESSKNFPVLINQMLAIGEESGTLSEICAKLSSFFEKDVDNIIKNLTSLLEPLLMLLIGSAIGFIMISIIKPIYELTSMI